MASAIQVDELATKILEPFIGAITCVAKMELVSETSHDAYESLKPNEAFAGDLTVVMPVFCETFSGTAALSFPRPTLVAFASRSQGGWFGDMIEVGAGELERCAKDFMALAFDQAKSQIRDSGFNLRPSVSSLLIGKNTPLMTRGARVRVKFTCAEGEFWFEML